MRLWNVETWRDLMQLSPGGTELGQVRSLAFSPDGKQLLAGGDRSAALWSAVPSVWNDSGRAALALGRLLSSHADFPSRIRMFSENPRLHEALAKLDRQDWRVQAALAAREANRYASRNEWPQAVAAFDRLVAADPSGPDGWLRTPGLLRLATALLHQNRPASAAALLQGGTRRRAFDGLPRLREGEAPAEPNWTAAPRGARPPRIAQAGLDGLPPATSGVGRGPANSAETEPLVRDAATDELLYRLRLAVNERLVQEPRNPALFELRAELGGQWSDAQAQVADYTAAIETLARQSPKAAAADLTRLYGRRGNAHLALRQWQQAIDDFARVVTERTTDEALLSNQALAMAEVILSRAISESSDPTTTDREHQRMGVVKFADPWQKLAAAYRLQGDERALDRLVDRHPKLAGPIGDLYAQEPNQSWQRAIEIYSKGITAAMRAIDEGGRSKIPAAPGMKDEGKPKDAPDSAFLLHPSSLFPRRARAHEALKNWDAAAADWSRAATGSADEPRLLAEFARRLAAGGQVPLARAQFEKSRARYENSLAMDPENVLLAAELAQLLCDEHENENATRWTVLMPMEIKSRGGGTLTLQDDGSILAVGVNPPSDEYTLTFIVPRRVEVRAIRLEALSHESLPGHGPGRGTRGSVPGLFELTRWDLTVKRPNKADSPRPLTFRAAAADHSMNNYPLGLLGRWNISWDAGRNHTSVWSVSDPITLEAGTQLRSQMQFNPWADWSDQNLGRFRVSISSDRSAFDGEKKRFAGMQVTDPWGRLAAAYGLVGEEQAVDKLLKRHPLAPVEHGRFVRGRKGLGAGHSRVPQAGYRTNDRRRLVDQTRSGLPGCRPHARGGRLHGEDICRRSGGHGTLSPGRRSPGVVRAGQGSRRHSRADSRVCQGRHRRDHGQRAAVACSILPSTDKAQRDRALALGRKAVHLGPGDDAARLALGMAEFRSGHFAEADAALFGPGHSGVPFHLTVSLRFYRAMSLYRQGKNDEARKLAIAAAAKMKPLPDDQNNPLGTADDAEIDLIMWLAYKEAKAMIQFDKGAPPQAQTDEN